MGNVVSSDDLLSREADYLEAYLLADESECFLSNLFDTFNIGKRRRLDVKNPRMVRPKTYNFWTTCWGLMLRNPLINDPNSWEGKKFRRRFRVDYATYNEIIVPLCYKENVFEMRNSSRIPIEMKILVAGKR